MTDYGFLSRHRSDKRHAYAKGLGIIATMCPLSLGERVRVRGKMISAQP